MRIIGIDPGLAITGYAVIEADGDATSVHEAGVVRTTEAESLEGRLRTLHDHVLEVLSEFKPEVMAVEELYSQYKFPRTAILMGHARGIIYLAAAECGIPVASYTSTRIKNCLTGNGRASKAQVQRAIQSRMNLSQLPEPDDVADALAVALCHARTIRAPAKALSRTQRARP